MFIDWQDGNGNWRTIKKPSYLKTQSLDYRVNQLKFFLSNKNNLNLTVAYDNYDQVKFYIKEILNILELKEKDIDLESLNKLLIEPGLLFPKPKEPKISVKKTKKSKDSHYPLEDLVANIWHSCGSLEDTLLLLRTFDKEEINHIIDRRNKYANPKKHHEKEVKRRAIKDYKEKMKKASEGFESSKENSNVEELVKKANERIKSQKTQKTKNANKKPVFPFGSAEDMQRRRAAKSRNKKNTPKNSQNNQ